MPPLMGKDLQVDSQGQAIQPAQAGIPTRARTPEEQLPDLIAKLQVVIPIRIETKKIRKMEKHIKKQRQERK